MDANVPRARPVNSIVRRLAREYVTYTDLLQLFGLPSSPEHRDEIRRLLLAEVDRGRQEDDGEEMLRTLCVQLFSLGFVEDCLLIWSAKQANFDACCGLDVQFLCGAGLQTTKRFLAASLAPDAAAALSWLSECEKAGDFEEFSPASWVDYYCRYYRLGLHTDAES